MIIDLFKIIFGPYCIVLSAEMLNQPNLVLTCAKFSCIVIINEPQGDTPINTGKIKLLTGGDAGPFQIMHVCNNIRFSNVDNAIKNRTCFIPCLSTFTDNTSQEARKFKKDPLFYQRIPMLAPAFLWIMTQYYSHYATEGLNKPSIITETEEAYWRENDVYAQFIEDNPQVLNELYPKFKLWFSDAFPGTKIPERSFFS